MDARDAIEGLFKITDKDRKVVPFLFNDVQERYYNARTNRDIILKARQQGFTSVILALWLWECVNTPNTNAVVVAHDKETTIALLEKVRLYIRRLPTQPELQYNSKQKLYFPKRNSTFFIGTAGTDSFGRSHTITHFHGSEVAQWKNGIELLTSIMPAVPDSGYVVLETTANGYGNDFHKMWEQAVAEKSNFKAHFFPWHTNEEYDKPGMTLKDVPHPMTHEYAPDPEEQLYMEEHNLPESRLVWRRLKLREPQYIEDPNLFRQEYPFNPEEAFLSSGEAFFPNGKVHEALGAARKPRRVGEINAINQFSDMEGGKLKIWKMPHEGNESFVIGADPSEGLMGGDPAAAVVLGVSSMEHYASWHGYASPEEFARLLFRLGQFYRGGLIGCENNGPGLVTVLKLAEMNYPRLYKMQYFDRKIRKTTSKVGWNTNSKTRDLLLQDLRTSINDESLLTFDKEFLKECLGFKKIKNKYQAEEGMHDDLIFAMGIAVQMRAVTPPPTPEETYDTYYEPINPISGY